ncbi:hypothetical protein CEXT_258111 [Caerostris extrusa]|uniref:Uncharacterized protein n=1 Tax=Caerostris extrusa TaxID=172846 RepID=A0AAV4P367_CAEEX|nr:hypothetical protein CEXT_258111 [Caerostris extrusa]
MGERPRADEKASTPRGKRRRFLGLLAGGALAGIRRLFDHHPSVQRNCRLPNYLNKKDFEKIVWSCQLECLSAREKDKCQQGKNIIKYIRVNHSPFLLHACIVNSPP